MFQPIQTKSTIATHKTNDVMIIQDNSRKQYNHNIEPSDSLVLQVPKSMQEKKKKRKKRAVSIC